MYEILRNKNSKSSYKRISRSGNFPREEFKKILEFLIQGKELPAIYRDHQLKGEISYKRKCHIKNDILLVYVIFEDTKKITLDDICNHSNIFGR